MVKSKLSQNLQSAKCDTESEVESVVDEDVERLLSVVEEPVEIVTVEPSRLRPFRLKFHVRKGTTDEKVVPEVVKTRVYEKRCLKQCLSDAKSPIWVDLGANIGTFAILAASHGRRVHAFEPEKQNYAMAKANARLNNVEDLITFHQKAVVPRTFNEKTTSLYLCNGTKNKYRHSTEWGYPGRVRRIETTQCCTLRDVFRYFPEATGMKMDIEGAEIGILENLHSIPRSLKYLVFEYSFDFCRSVGRFHAIVRRLSTWFYIEHKRIEGDDKGNYNYYPPACIVYCVRRKRKRLFCEINKLTVVEHEAHVMSQVTKEILSAKLPKRKRASAYSGNCQSVVFGLVFIKYATQAPRPAQCNRLFPKLYVLLKDLIKIHDPTFKYTSIQVNLNVMCKPHTDSYNFGETVLIGLGRYHGGCLVVEHKRDTPKGTKKSSKDRVNKKDPSTRVVMKYNVRRKFIRFYGRHLHWVEPWKGDRVTIMFYTNKKLMGLTPP